MRIAIRRALVAIVLASATAHAEDAIVKGSIVKVEHEEIYVNLGTSQAVVDGAPLRIKRAIRLRHPVTRAAIEDWVPIGAAVVTQAGGQLARAVVGELVTAVKPGDIVEVLVDRPDPEAPAPTPAPTPAAPQADPATMEVLAAFVAQTGQPLDARIAMWERYLSTRPGSPYAEAIRSDLVTLQSLREQMRPPSATDDDTVSAKVEHLPRSRVVARTAVPVVFVIGRPEQVASAYLHYRRRDRRTYSRVLLAREHDIYLRGTLPADVVEQPGVDYFVEVSTPTGRSGLALASPEAPIQIGVERPALVDRFAATPGRTSVRLSGELLQFATFDRRDGDRRDSMYAAAIDFGYRLEENVRRIGVGYGAIGGIGGAADAVWDGMAIPKTGFHYGRADVDLGTAELGIGVSLIAGVGKKGFGTEGFGMGFETRVRAGRAEDTNVSAVARTIPQVGWLAELRLGTQPFVDVLAGVSVGATNQPVADELAAKLGVDFEWIRYEHVSFLVRGSWQGRSTRHGGLGGGAAVGFTW